MTRRRDAGGLIACVLGLSVGGCSSEDERSKTILPSLELGRQAIVATMESWAKGRPTGGVESTSPRIQVMDTTRRPGQVATKYELVGETTGERALAYVVKVELANPAATETIRFLVLGIDPVLVWRQEDYDMMSHWEHKMDPIPAESPQ